MVRCGRTCIDVELYKNFYAKLGVQIWTTLVSNGVLPILGDPGAVRGDGEKSKTGKKMQAKKSQEREEEPLGTMF